MATSKITPFQIADAATQKNKNSTHLQEVQHQIRNKVGIIGATFELMHPIDKARTAEEAEDIHRIHRALSELIKISDNIK